jgi:hypothetical protein
MKVWQHRTPVLMIIMTVLNIKGQSLVQCLSAAKKQDNFWSQVSDGRELERASFEKIVLTGEIRKTISLDDTPTHQYDQ